VVSACVRYGSILTFLGGTSSDEVCSWLTDVAHHLPGDRDYLHPLSRSQYHYNFGWSRHQRDAQRQNFIKPKVSSITRRGASTTPITTRCFSCLPPGGARHSWRSTCLLPPCIRQGRTTWPERPFYTTSTSLGSDDRGVRSRRCDCDPSQGNVRPAGAQSDYLAPRRCLYALFLDYIPGQPSTTMSWLPFGAPETNPGGPVFSQVNPGFSW